MNVRIARWLRGAVLLAALLAAPLLRAQPFASHPPQRPLPSPSARAMAEGPARFVDPVRGNDADDGGKEKPWKTIRHALPLLSAGDTLALRGGSYFENVYCAVAGTA